MKLFLSVLLFCFPAVLFAMPQFMCCTQSQVFIADTSGERLFDFSDCMLLAEQKEQRIVIANVKQKKIVWEWKASEALSPEYSKWFSNPSDAKLVYNGTHILTTASGGGVALIRISDKQTVFYTYVGGNTHSAELLPDGNIISASSTGNYLTLIVADTLKAPEDVFKKNITVDFAHNVVWDKQNRLLWSAGRHKILAFAYNFDCENPDLILKESYELPGTEGHDLFPDFGTNSLWLTNSLNVFRFDVEKRKLFPAKDVELQAHIKSVSSGPPAYPAIVIKPKESWWTDEVVDIRGRSVFIQAGLRIYKARWMLPVPFSYPPGDVFKLCK